MLVSPAACRLHFTCVFAYPERLTREVIGSPLHLVTDFAFHDMVQFAAIHPPSG